MASLQQFFHVAPNLNCIIFPFSNRRTKSALFSNQRTDRADIHCLLCNLRRNMFSQLRIDTDFHFVPAASECKIASSFFIFNTTNTPLAENASIMIFYQQRISRINSPHRKHVRKARNHHSVTICKCLQIASATRAMVDRSPSLN